MAASPFHIEPQFLPSRPSMVTEGLNAEAAGLHQGENLPPGTLLQWQIDRQA